MSEPENFLSRWSRRKQDAARQSEQQGDSAREQAVSPQPTDVDGQAPQPQAGADAKLETEFDLSSLPPIESIGSGTDIRLFLQKGVPQELTRAALRRAWTTDPTIRDFIEVAENQWDFATGKDLPGFGPLEASDDVRRMVAEVFQRPLEAPSADPQDSAKPADEASTQTAQNDKGLPSPEPAEQGPDDGASAHKDSSPTELASQDIVRREEERVALQQEPENSDSVALQRRSHGRALPQ